MAMLLIKIHTSVHCRSEEDFCVCVYFYSSTKDPLVPGILDLNKLGKTPLGNATYHKSSI